MVKARCTTIGRPRFFSARLPATPTTREAIDVLSEVAGAVEDNPAGPEGAYPAEWVIDEDLWEKAKKEAKDGGYMGEKFWIVLVTTYRQMGGFTA